MATFTVNPSMNDTADTTQNVTVGDTVVVNMAGAGSVFGAITQFPIDNCTFTVTQNGSGAGTESGNITGFTAGQNYLVTFRQDDANKSFLAVSVTGTVQAGSSSDGNITVSLSNIQQSSTETGNSVVSISNGNSSTDYRVLITSSGTGQAIGTQAGPTRNGNGTINIPSNRQPTAGNVVSYKVQFADAGGSNWADATGTNVTFTIGRINNFTFQDVNPAGIGSTVIRSVQVNGLRSSFTASKVNGSGDFAVNSSSSSSGATFNTSNKTISNGQYIHNRIVASSTANTTLSNTIRVSGTSLLEDDFWSVTTGAASYSISAPASINEGSAGTINVTTSGVPNSTVLYWNLDQSSDYTTSQGTVTISSNAGSFSITPSADSQTEGSETDTVRLYTDSARTNEVASDSFTINDTSQGSGGSSGSGDGNQTYGVEVYWTDGSTILFSSNLTQTNVLVIDSPVISAGGTKTYIGVPDATLSTKIAVSISGYGFDASSDSFTVGRSTANGGTITITNDTAVSITPDVLIYRIA